MERKVSKMKEIEKIKMVAEFAKAHAQDSREANNICETVFICCNSVLDTLDMCKPIAGYTSDFFKGVLYGKVHFLDQMTLLMAFHFKVSLGEFQLSQEALWNEVQAEGGEK